MSDSLHPDVKKFKGFVREHPYILRDVNSGEKTLQDLFEEWMLFGEEDEIWETYREPEEAEEESDEGEGAEEDGPGEDVLAMLKKMNLNDIQHHLGQFSTVVESVQQLISQFRQQQNPSPPPGQQDQQSPFSFRED